MSKHSDALGARQAGPRGTTGRSNTVAAANGPDGQRVWRSRIVREADADPRTIEAHPANWRTHPPGQAQALDEVLTEVGWVQRVVVSERTGLLLDGHLRIERAVARGESSVPVVYVDVTKDEERLVLATMDPIAALAKVNQERLTDLLTRLSDKQRDLVSRLKIGGFRQGRGHVRDGVRDWATAGDFFSVPAEVAPVLARAQTLVVQFSGGKDSTAAALWAAKNRGDRRLQLVFTDPGVEFPGITAHVAEVSEFLNAECVIVKPPEDWWVMIRRDGWPSLLHRPCAMQFVHHPFGEHLKKLDPETTLLFTGSRAEEAVRGSTKTATSRLTASHTRTAQFEHFAPCFSAKKPVLEQVIAESGVPLWEGYSRGFVRTACWCCPGQCGLQAYALTQVYPGLAEEIRRWERRVGKLQPLAVGRDGQAGKSFDDLARTGEAKRAKKSGEQTQQTQED